MVNLYHKPVLLTEALELLKIRPQGVYVDATFGGGGHTQGILNQVQDIKLIAIDQDSDVLPLVNALQSNYNNLYFKQSNFKDLAHTLSSFELVQVDGILADLGVSSHQFDAPERGFSYRFDAYLDMRMNPTQEKSASNILNEYSSYEIADVLRKYGEVKFAGRIAQAIAKSREFSPILTTFQFNRIIEPFLPKHNSYTELSKIYQAIRIEVNAELQALTNFLIQTGSLLRSGGRLVIIAYHSLEDRLVKNFMRSGNIHGNIEKDFFGNPMIPFKVITSKPICPSPIEIEQNPRARSARLRAAEKI